MCLHVHAILLFMSLRADLHASQCYQSQPSENATFSENSFLGVMFGSTVTNNVY